MSHADRLANAASLEEGSHYAEQYEEESEGENYGDGDGDGLDMDPEAAAMAAAMGFSSFGAQDRPAKKRRFNRDDEASATGANRMALHPRESRAAAQQQTTTGSAAVPLLAVSKKATENADEIDLGDDDDNDGGDDGSATNISSSSTTNPAGLAKYAAPSLPARPPAPAASYPAEGAGRGSGSHAFSPAPSAGGPRYQQQQPHQSHRGGRGGGSVSGNGRREWWINYYDPSSNENPWEHLERERNLRPAAGSSWLALPWASGNQSGGDGGRGNNAVTS
ncbi:hypothetical protein B0T26DRAFT_680529 [Lasiosphaeria miniovina]|uniref:Uncharacterized protein n=1 Tax=Lasiosphaeria miniovina TaxID=1954250 RepID=A0AA40DMR7_9PEZI|nr:uncharacterized protein B0T26DRAFT_680529 [Lasiosphaeria miniovina]KAK0706926.1 hypothetical protein B0T26DRAFT_680529 [Lasiosphaeria miniovina]